MNALCCSANVPDFGGFYVLVPLLTEFFNDLTLIFIILSALRAYLPVIFQIGTDDIINPAVEIQPSILDAINQTMALRLF